MALHVFVLALSFLEIGMQYKAHIFSKEQNFFLENFLKKYNFIFVSLSDLRLLNEVIWIFFGNDQDSQNAENLLKETKNIKAPIIYYLPHILKNFETKIIDKKFFYPLDIGKFERIILNKHLFDIFEYEDILIESSNLVKNKNKNLSVYFTEKEIDLFKKLIDSQKIKKQKIKTEILNFNSLLNTRSLESHLSRIRKKLIAIQSTINIISEKDDYISIN